MRRVPAVFAAVAALLTGLVLCAAPAEADGGPPPGTPTAQSFGGTPTVGAIFRNGLSMGHECSGSVIVSRSRDLVLTAAHCVYGRPSGWSFVPGYVDGRTPHGVWTVTAAYVDPRWQRSENTQYDYAILRVAPQRIGGRAVRIQDVTGGNLLGTAPAPGTRITDIAYNAGIDDRPIRCTVPVHSTKGYPGFLCSNYQGGVSGSPFLARSALGTRTVVGVIGGLHQGGCYDWASYSSRFTPAVYRLLARAASHAKPDVVRMPGGDGC